jgi:cysteine desulfurase / selenocysteine lyase
MTIAAREKPRTVTKFDPHKVRADFPILHTKVHGRPLVYLDNGATTQKPRQVIDAISRYYETTNANIHRGVYQLSQDATTAYEQAREKVARFINAPESPEVIFTRGTTEGINLVAACWGRTFLKAGDEVVVSNLEHHSNIVPSQIACDATGAKLRVIPINDAGELDLGEYEAMLKGHRVKFVSVVHLSNSLGTINDVKAIARLAHQHGALVLVDGAQWVAHYPTDVQDLGVDFYAFSGHKLYGPTGIGVLWGRRELLEKMPPYQGGGDMIETVTFAKTTYAQLPNKFEAGTPDIAGAVGLGAAIDYLAALDFAFVDHEHALLEYATAELNKIPGVRIIGTAEQKGSVISFVVEEPPISVLDLGTRLDREGVAVRTGHHCCMPVMERMKVPATTRASLAMYNTREDVDALVAALRKIVATAASKPAVSQAAAATPAPAMAAGGLPFAPASAASPDEAADELAETFEFLGDRDARNEYVLDLAKKLPNAFDELKVLTPRVPGCMSEVYLVGRRAPGTSDVLEFAADANADIVRGLIAVLQKLFSGQKGSAVAEFDVARFFSRIGLEQFITSQRRNGLDGMVRRIKALAKEIAA